MKTFISLGCGVNSTAILALIAQGELNYENPLVTFADTGAEKLETYEYLEYLKTVSPLPINVVQSKEGSLKDYCFKREILPMRVLRWCSDRWKQKPLTDFRKQNLNESELEADDWVTVIGIGFEERHRARRWLNDIHAKFPLIEKQVDRDGCVKIIKKSGWRVPVKSGCYFCPFASLDELAELKIKHPNDFLELVALEKKAFAGKAVAGSWNDKYRLDELIERKRPASVEGQCGLVTKCVYCWG